MMHPNSKLQPRDRQFRPIRILRQPDGRFAIEGAGAWHTYLRDPYHLMLMVPWISFIGIIAGIYLLINVLFASLYLLGGDCIAGARPGSFEDAFFFSVQTFGTIGYGVYAPSTVYANSIVTAEAIACLLMVAVVTGLAFARFSKPTARVIFSHHAVVSAHNGVPTLMFRVANQRRNQLLEAHINAYLLRDEVTAEGDYYYRVHNLNLMRSQQPSLMLTWTVMHSLDEHSPLRGCTAESLVERHAQIIIVLRGIDSTTAYGVNTQHIYGAHNILLNHRLVDIIQELPNGDRAYDRGNFHKVVPVSTISENPESRYFGLG